MICQHCGKFISLNDTCIVEFNGVLMPVNAKWTACEKCANDLYIDVCRTFNSETIKRCLKVYYATEGVKANE